jgi:glycosyltransferase involved in cell wall biosynthesis
VDSASAVGARMPDKHKNQVLMLLSNCFDPDPRVYAEARALVEHGYDVSILAWDRDHKKPAKEVIDGIHVERIHLRSTHGRGATQIFFMAAVLIVFVWKGLFRRFDVIHAHDFDTLPAGVLMAILRRKTLVYDAHEDYASMLYGNIPPAMERFLLFFEKQLLRSVDLLITVGEKLRAEFERRGARRTVVVGNWKKLDEYRTNEGTRRAVRDELNVPQDALLVCYIASLTQERHIPELLAALNQRPIIHAVIGGGGSVAPQVEEHAKRHPNVHFLGFVQHQRIPRYTIASDVVYYGFEINHPNARYSAPNKLFEALATGLPVISADFGEIGRIVRENDCGILLDNFSEKNILQALDLCGDPQGLEKWKLNAANIGRTQYNWSHAENALLSAYENLLNPASVSATEIGEVHT